MLDDLILSGKAYQRLAEGVAVTLQVFAWSVLLGAALSLIFGIARLSDRAWVRSLASVYVEFGRGVSAIILLFWMFFALPILFGIRAWPAMLAGVLALGINMGAYGAEVVRGGIQAVPKGQTEASIALNLTERQRLRSIILPQAIPIILPPFGNLMIEILKGTALVALITVSDLLFEIEKLRVNRVVVADSASTPALYINGLIIYFILAQIISTAFGFFERRVARQMGVE